MVPKMSQRTFASFSRFRSRVLIRFTAENTRSTEHELKGSTALILSCQKGHDLCARALIDAKANLEPTQEGNFTALMISCQNGHDLCTQALLVAGAAVDKMGQSVTEEDGE